MRVKHKQFDTMCAQTSDSSPTVSQFIVFQLVVIQAWCGYSLCNSSVVCLPIRNMVQPFLCMTLRDVTLCLVSVLKFLIARVAADTSLLNSSDFSITLLLFVSLSRGVHLECVWTVIWVGSSRSILLSSFFNKRFNQKKFCPPFSFYTRILIEISYFSCI